MLLKRLKATSLRARLVALACAICLVALTGTLLAVTLARQNAAPPAPRAIAVATSAASAARATVTATATSTATASPSPAATRAQTRHAQAPPPPPVPRPPQASPTPASCPTPTPLPKPTDTPAPAGAPPTTPTTTIPTTAGAAPAAACRPCPYYAGDNPSQAQISVALNTAADMYGVPRNLVRAVAWQESRWHEDVVSCDGGIGLMQIQYYTYPWLNGQSVPVCGLSTTSYDPYTLDGNARLGAKYLKWLSCFYSYWGANGGTSPSSPGAYTIAWYYQQAGLPYPDTGTPNSLCAAVFNDPARPEYAALPSDTSQPWSCPYSATAGDNTLLDATLSAYNEGADNFNRYGIFNQWYVSGVEGWIPQFASGALP